MPQHDVWSFEIRAVKLEHAHTGQAGQRARGQSGRRRIHGKATVQKPPASEGRRHRVEQTGGEADDPLGEEPVRPIVVKQDRKDS